MPVYLKVFILTCLVVCAASISYYITLMALS